MGYFTYAPLTENYGSTASAKFLTYHIDANIAGDDYLFSGIDVWQNASIPDFGDLQRRMNLVLQQNPAAKFVLRLSTGLPEWWYDANPSELEATEDGSVYNCSNDYTLYNKNYEHFISPAYTIESNHSYRRSCRRIPSLSSDIYVNFLKKKLAYLVTFLKNTYPEKISGFVFTGLGTQEFYHWDLGLGVLNYYDFLNRNTNANRKLLGFGMRTQLKFRDYLRAKYQNNVSLLQLAWGRSGITFDTVYVPSLYRRLGRNLDPGSRSLVGDNYTFLPVPGSQDVIDFYIFWNAIIPQFVNQLSAELKSLTNNKYPVGALMGSFNAQGGDPSAGRSMTSIGMRGTAIDFFVSEPFYDNRTAINGGDHEVQPLTSFLLNGKNLIHENDMFNIGTINDCQSLSPSSYCTTNAYTNTVEKNIWLYKRFLGMSLANGMHSTIFNQQGQTLTREPGLIFPLAELNDKLRQITNPGISVAQILVISDEISTFYVNQMRTINGAQNSLLNRSLHDPMKELSKLGAPFDHIFMADIEKINPVNQYRFVILLNAYYLTPVQRELIRNRFYRDNKVVLFAYAAGYYNGTDRSTLNIQYFTQFKIDKSNYRRAPGFHFVANHPLGQKIISQIGTDWYQPDDGSCCQEFSVNDPQAFPLAYYPGTSIPSMALKNLNTGLGWWTGVWTALPALDAKILREMARYANVFIYNNVSDAFYVNSRFITIHGSQTGSRYINFPAAVLLYDLQTGTLITNKGKVTTLYIPKLNAGETLLYQIMN